MEDGKDELYMKALEKLPYCWMLYLYGKASTPEEFARVEEEFKKQAEAEAKIKAEAEAKAEEEKVMAAKVEAAKVDPVKVDAPVADTPTPAPAP
jgi:hypothetical protein